MSKTPKSNEDLPVDLIDAIAADSFAEEMDDILLDIADLNPDLCPPDRRYVQTDREAWVYEHGNIAELVFVKTA
ncbi:MAG: hypothetical protein QNJ29_14035 [Rhizobiaceae bacterium]|nr:hypothetical protein [Rhizobiaceae bacterium]